MFRLTLAQMRRSVGRLVAAGLAIAIGTAFVAATLLAGDVMNRTGRDAVTARYGQADVVVSGDHVRASLEVAVVWGLSLAVTAAEVRRRVSHGLSGVSGLVVDGVDVHVRSVVAPEHEGRKALQ